jgi:hypothetical protein
MICLLGVLNMHIFVLVPNQDLGFQGDMSFSLLCSVSSVKMRDDCSCC